MCETLHTKLCLWCLFGPCLFHCCCCHHFSHLNIIILNKDWVSDSTTAYFSGQHSIVVWQHICMWRLVTHQAQWWCYCCSQRMLVGCPVGWKPVAWLGTSKGPSFLCGNGWVICNDWIFMLSVHSGICSLFHRSLGLLAQFCLSFWWS